MKNQIKNILVSLLAFAAVSTAAAGQEYSNIFAKKTAENNYDGTYTLTMQTYATGNQVLVETRTSVDAVVILDMSGSMSSEIKSNVRYTLRKDSNQSIYTLKTLLASDKEPKDYYIYWSDGNYYQLSGTKKSYATFTVGGVTYGMNADGTLHSGCTPVPDAYKSVVLHVKVGRLTRQEALNEAFSIFLSNLKVDQQQWNAEHASASEQVTHRVSIIWFNQTAANPITFDSGNVGDDTNYMTIINKVVGLSRNSGTFAELAFALAKNVMNTARTDATKACVFFTDGYPDDWTWKFNRDNASEAIGYSLVMKNAGAKVYSMNVIDLDESQDEAKFMEYVSSNYPTAANMDSPGNKESSDYFTLTPDQETLTATFDAISKKIITGGSTPKLDNSAYLLDIVSDYFMLPDGAENASVEAYTNDLTSISSGNYNFGTAKSTTGLSTTISGKQIKVTGFSYTDNFCGTHIDSETLVSEVRGKRLVVKVTIIPDPDKDTGYSPTNDEDSGIYTSDGDIVKKFVTEPSAVYSHADLTVKVSGLSAGESAVFTITSNEDVTLYGETGKFTQTVVLTGPDASVIVKAPSVYKDASGNEKFVTYTVTPTAWPWTYDVTPDSISKTLFETDAAGVVTLDNVYEFKAEKSDSVKVLNGEGAKQNVFKDHTNPSGSGSTGSGSTGSGSGSR